MTIEQDIITRLAGIAGDRIYPEPAPQTTTAPYVTYDVIDRESVYGFGGDTGLENVTVGVDVWASSMETAHTILAAVTAAMAPPGLDFVVGRVTGENNRYDPHRQRYGLSAVYSCWVPGVGVVTYTMLTDSGGVALTDSGGVALVI